jgi:hypothetical protein
VTSAFYQQWSGLGEFFKIGAGGVEKVEPLYISKVCCFLVFRRRDFTWLCFTGSQILSHLLLFLLED